MNSKQEVAIVTLGKLAGAMISKLAGCLYIIFDEESKAEDFLCSLATIGVKGGWMSKTKIAWIVVFEE